MGIKWYYNGFIPGATNKTNDLSLVVIVQFGAFKIVFAGDLEVSGWRRLLSHPDFRFDLIGTNIFVASHHGRASGCCTELFDWLLPEIVIISDDERQYESQDTDDWYRNRCLGAAGIANPLERRYVMTTRKDGSMKIDVSVDGRWILHPVSVRDWPRKPMGAPSAPSDFSWLSALNPGLNRFPSGPNLLDPPKHSAFASLSKGYDPLAAAFGLSPLSKLLSTKR